MAYFGCVNKSSSPPEPQHDYLYKWDFTKSLVDEVQGVEAVLNNGATRDSGGVHIDNYGGKSVYLLDTFSNGYTLEIDFGEVYDSHADSPVNGYNMVINFPYNTSDYGFRYYRRSDITRFGVRQQGHGDRARIDVVGADAFSNKTLKFIFTSLTDLKIFINDDKVYDYYSFIKNDTSSALQIGGNSSNDSFYPMTIKAVRIYENEEV